MAAMPGSAVRLLMFGAPGVGKGTQAAVLCGRLGIPHLATGDMLRAAIRGGTPEGLEARAIVERGELVPDALISALVGARLALPDMQDGFILDGFPRTLSQAETLGDLLVGIGFPEPLVFNLGVDENRLEERISRRLTCSVCQEIYNSVSHGPKISGRCDRCEGLLEARADDNKSVLQERIADFRSQTEPLVSYYRARGSLVDILGDRDIGAVGADILASVNGRANGMPQLRGDLR